MRHPQPCGYSCEQCQSLRFEAAKLACVPQCGVCQQPLTEVEAINVINKARIIYVAGWAGVAAIFLAIAVPTLSQNPESWLARGLLIIGVFGSLFVVSYLGFACLQLALGLSGWRWLVRKTVPKQPPAWYHVPTLGRALVRESFVSLAIVILFVLLTMIRGLFKG